MKSKVIDIQIDKREISLQDIKPWSCMYVLRTRITNKVYILHTFPHDSTSMWGFLSLQDSKCWGCGYQGTDVGAVKAAMRLGDVYECQDRADLKEFL